MTASAASADSADSTMSAISAHTATPTAYCYRKLVAVTQQGVCCYCVSYAVGKLFTLPGIRTGNKNHKLLASIAHKEVCTPNAGIDYTRGVLQHHIADIVPKGVVDTLKVVDIKHQTSALLAC